MRHFDIDIPLLSDFFLEMVLPIFITVRSRSGFCLFNANSWNCSSGLVLLYFFVSLSDALFHFTFVHPAKLKRSYFLNGFFLSLTAFARMTSVLSLSLSLSLSL